MPTGYTAAVQEGSISFEDFVLNCASAMGAFYHQREGSGAKPSKRVVDNLYYTRKIDNLQQKYDSFTELSEDEQHALYDTYLAEAKERDMKNEASRLEWKRRYAEMLVNVMTWEVPESLDSLKEFMEEQLRSSIEFDCGRSRYTSYPSFNDWLDWNTTDVLKDISNTEKRYRAEIESVKEQNKYYDDLMRSLGL